MSVFRKRCVSAQLACNAVAKQKSVSCLRLKECVMCATWGVSSVAQPVLWQRRCLLRLPATGQVCVRVRTQVRHLGPHRPCEKLLKPMNAPENVAARNTNRCEIVTRCLGSGAHRTRKSDVSAVPAILGFGYFRNSRSKQRLLGAEAAQECHSEVRLGAPCRWEGRI